MYAIRAGRSLEVLTSMISLGADWNLRNKDNSTVLHVACYKMHQVAVELLAPLGMVNAKDNAGRTPLHQLIEAPSSQSCEAQIQVLINYGANVNSRDTANHTPLHYAINMLSRAERHLVVNLLLDNGAWVDAKDVSFRTPLEMAIKAHEEGELEECTVQLIQLSKQKYLSDEINALEVAIQEGGDLCTLTKLIEEGGDVNRRTIAGCTPLHLAFSGETNDNLLDILMVLVENKADVNARDDDGRTPLHWSAESKSDLWLDAVKYLVEKGADVKAKDAVGWNIVHFHAVRSLDNFERLTTWLVATSNGDLLSDVSSHDVTPLHMALLRFEPEKCLLDQLINFVNVNCVDNGNNGLLWYAVSGNRSVAFLQTLVDKGADWDCRNHYGETMLHHAAEMGNAEALQLFIQLGCSVNAENANKETPLLSAFEGDSSDGIHAIVRILLEKGGDVSATNSKSQTALDLALEKQKTGQVEDRTVELLRIKMRQGVTGWLHSAAFKGDLASVKKFVEFGSDVNQIVYGKTPLQHALLEAKPTLLDILEVLIDNNAEVNGRDENGNTPLHYAVSDCKSQEWLHAVQYLVQKGGDVTAKNKLGKTILLISLANRTNAEYHELLEWMLEQCSFDNVLKERCDAGQAAIHIAVHDLALKEETLDLLLKYNDINDLDDMGNGVLAYAIQGNRSLPFLRLLASRNADWNWTGKCVPPMHFATFSGSADGIQLWIEKGVSVNSKDVNGNTPLHLAVKSKPEKMHEIVYLLLTNGADANAFNFEGQSPLDILKEFELNFDPRILTLLLNCKELTQPMSTHGVGRLHRMSQLGDLPALTELIQVGGCDVNERNAEGETPLHRVFSGGAKDNLLEILRTLLDNGADVNTRDDLERTPLHWAVIADRSADCLGAVEYMVQRGGDINARDKYGEGIAHLCAHYRRTQVEFSRMIHWLVENSHEDVLKGVAHHHHTPLHHAVSRFELEESLLDVLLNFVDINVVDKEGDSVLSWAVEGQRSGHFLKLLVRKGADWRWKNNSESSMLHVAALTGNVEAVQFFLEMDRSEINSKSNDGSTPLHSVFQLDHDNVHEIVKVLLERGADTGVRNDAGLTPLDLAVAKQKMGKVEEETVELMISSRLLSLTAN